MVDLGEIVESQLWGMMAESFRARGVAVGIAREMVSLHLERFFVPPQISDNEFPWDYYPASIISFQAGSDPEAIGGD